jgi:hypothetical protein
MLACARALLARYPAARRALLAAPGGGCTGTGTGGGGGDNSLALAAGSSPAATDPDASGAAAAIDGPAWALGALAGAHYHPGLRAFAAAGVPGLIGPDQIKRPTDGGPVVVIELDMVRGSVHIRLPDGASASIDDVIVYGGSARDRRKDPPSEGKPHVVLTGRVVMGSVSIRGPRRPPLRRGPSTALRD